MFGFGLSWQNQDTCVQGLWFSVIFFNPVNFTPKWEKKKKKSLGCLLI